MLYLHSKIITGTRFLLASWGYVRLLNRHHRPDQRRVRDAIADAHASERSPLAEGAAEDDVVQGHVGLVKARLGKLGISAVIVTKSQWKHNVTKS
jgi:hypothetical protein